MSIDSPKLQKLESLEQVNGKIEDQESGANVDASKTKELESILGITEVNPFGTANEKIFEENLASMNMTDMQRLAVRVGVMPSSTRTTLKNKLKRKFKAQARNVNSVAPQGKKLFCNEQPLMDLNTEEGKRAAKLMKEGL